MLAYLCKPGNFVDVDAADVDTDYAVVADTVVGAASFVRAFDFEKTAAMMLYSCSCS